MRLAILSDIHDQIWHLQTALPTLATADQVIFCGDLNAPFTLGLLAGGLAGRPLHVVFGNNDGDLFRISQVAARFANIQLHGESWRGQLGQHRIAVHHFPEVALALADSGHYDLVCYGHDHTHAIGRRGTTITINPGSILGFQAATSSVVPPTFVMIDLDSSTIESYQINYPAAHGSVEPYRPA